MPGARRGVSRSVRPPSSGIGDHVGLSVNQIAEVSRRGDAVKGSHLKDLSVFWQHGNRSLQDLAIHLQYFCSE